MSFTTYSGLQTEIASYMKRTNDSELVAQIPSFIALCEAEIGRALRTWRMESLETLTIGVGDPVVALPTTCRDIKWVKLSGTNEQIITHLPVPAFYALYSELGASAAPSGTPRHYTMRESSLIVGPSPDTDYTATALCVLAPVALSNTNPANTLLTNYPDIYFYGSLVHGFRYVRNMERMQEAEQAFMTAINGANKESRKLRASGTADGIRSIGRRRIP